MGRYISSTHMPRRRPAPRQGASGGIGRAVCCQLAARGADVIMVRANLIKQSLIQ